MTELTNACNFADDTTFHVCDSSLEDFVNRLEHDTNLPIEWFDSNYTKQNEDKCHLIISTHKSKVIWAKIGQTKIWESKSQKLLAVIVEHQLNLDEYLILLYKNTGKKLSALPRLAKFLSLE